MGKLGFFKKTSKNLWLTMKMSKSGWEKVEMCAELENFLLILNLIGEVCEIGCRVCEFYRKVCDFPKKRAKPIERCAKTSKSCALFINFVRIINWVQFSFLKLI